MKNIRIKKSNDFSAESKICLHIGAQDIAIKGFELFSFPVHEGEEVFVSHLWTRSRTLSYDQISDKKSYIIRPKLGKLLAFISIVVFMVCSVIFIFTKYRWSFLPLAPIVIYIVLYLSLFRNRYLFLESSKED